MDRIALYLTKVWPPNRLPSTRVRHSCNLPGKKLGFWATYLPIFQTPGVQRYSPIRKHRLHLCLSVPLKETHFLLLPCANSHQLPKQWALPAWLRPGCPPPCPSTLLSTSSARIHWWGPLPADSPSLQARLPLISFSEEDNARKVTRHIEWENIN